MMGKREYERIVGGAPGDDEHDDEPAKSGLRRKAAWLVALVVLAAVGALGLVRSQARATAGTADLAAKVAEEASMPCCSFMTGCMTCGLPDDLETTEKCNKGPLGCQAGCGGSWCPFGTVHPLKPPAPPPLAVAAPPGGAVAEEGAEKMIKPPDTTPCCSFMTGCANCGVPDDPGLSAFCDKSALACSMYCAGMFCPFGKLHALPAPPPPKQPLPPGVSAEDAEPCCSIFTGCMTCGLPDDTVKTAKCNTGPFECQAGCGGNWCPFGKLHPFAPPATTARSPEPPEPTAMAPAMDDAALDALESETADMIDLAVGGKTAEAQELAKDIVDKLAELKAAERPP